MAGDRDSFVLRTHGRRPVRRRLVAAFAAIVVLSSGLPLGVAARSSASTTHWSRGESGKAVAKVHVESGRAAAGIAKAQPRASSFARLPQLRADTGAHAAGPQAPSSRSATKAQIVIPDLVVPKQFGGLGQAESGNAYPADPWVAASSAYVVQVVNEVVRISNRDGATLLTVPSWALFAVPVGQLATDARVIWDAAHGRWVAEVLSFIDDLTFSLNYQILAVSDTSDPTAGWTTYQFAYFDQLPDYPSLSSSANKIVVADNLFDSSFNYLAAHVTTVTWASITGGGNLSRIECFGPGLVHPRAAQVLSPGSDVHLISEAIADGTQWYDRITGSGDCFSGQYLDETNVSLAFGFNSFLLPPDPRQSGPDPLANAIDERPTDAIWMAGKLWWVSTFPATFDGGVTLNDSVVLWGATVPTSGPPTFNDVQQISPGDGIDAFMGGIGMSRDGTLFVVYSQSSATDTISLYANRVAGGSLGTPELLDTSEATTTQDRWGDFAGVATDPVGTGAVWATHMLVDGDGAWRTDVARLLVDADAPTNPGAATATAEMSKTLTSHPNYRIAWPASSDAASGTVTYLVEESVDAGAYGAPTWLTTASFVRALPLGHAYRFRVTAFDALGNSSGAVAGTLLQPLVANSPTSKSGTWHTSSSSNYWGGSTLYASAAGASATYKTTGVRSIAFVTTKAASRGSFKVYIDGVYKGTISAHSSTAYRQVVYQYTWATAGTHTIKIVVKGTAGHPRVDFDAVLLLK